MFENLKNTLGRFSKKETMQIRETTRPEPFPWKNKRVPYYSSDDPQLDGKKTDFTNRQKNEFKMIKAKNGIAIVEFKPVTIYKCCICGNEIECGEKVVMFSKNRSFKMDETETVACHFNCVKRVPNIITDMFNAIIAEKV